MVHDKTETDHLSHEIQTLRGRLAQLEGAEANRQQAEAALARSEAFTQKLVEAAPGSPIEGMIHFIPEVTSWLREDLLLDPESL